MWPPGSADTVCPARLDLTLIFGCLTLKLVCESHLKWGTFIPNLGTLGFWILELFARPYVREGRTDRRTDKGNAYFLFPYGRGHNNNRCGVYMGYRKFHGGEVVHGEEKVNIWDTRRLQAPALLRCWARLAVARQVRNDRRRTT